MKKEICCKQKQVKAIFDGLFRTSLNEEPYIEKIPKINKRAPQLLGKVNFSSV